MSRSVITEETLKELHHAEHKAGTSSFGPEAEVLVHVAGALARELAAIRSTLDAGFALVAGSIDSLTEATRDAGGVS
jgi:hypothetical protein